MPAADVIDYVAPVFQRYLVGALDQDADRHDGSTPPR
jgi:hypothetical protein